MRCLTRWASLFALVTFVGLISAESLHIHALVQADNACIFCSLAHQTPIPSAPAIVQHVAALIGDSPVLRFAEPIRAFIAVSNGRSPPTL